MNKENKSGLDDNQIKDVSAEILDHMMYPRNYGKLEEAQGVGMCVDKKTGEFVMLYINIHNDIVNTIQFGANACQDTIVAGSLFTEMVKGDSLKNAIRAAKLMDEKLENAPKKQQACSRLVLRAFDAALINRDNQNNGKDEEFFTIDLKETCDIDEDVK
ncbi:MAG: iron-sulfur cluster assembly scaffold protein [Campylobacterales bacterium]|nr:iron-sulfur cluster assembly scaffold protein [Campylobacterales bacterium]